MACGPPWASGAHLSRLTGRQKQDVTLGTLVLSAHKNRKQPRSCLVLFGV